MFGATALAIAGYAIFYLRPSTRVRRAISRSKQCCRLGHFDAAREAASAALRLASDAIPTSPAHMDAVLQLAVVLGKLRRFRKALVCLDELIAMVASIHGEACLEMLPALIAKVEVLEADEQLSKAAEELSRDGGLEDMIVKRVGFTATELPDGRVLLVGGAGVDGSGQPNKLHDSVEIYDPRVGQFFPASERLHLSTVRAWHTATLLADGRVVVFGGLSVVNGAPAPTGTIELIDPMSAENPVTVLAATTPSGLERWGHQSTLLEFDGSVLVTGGLDRGNQALASVLRLVPGPGGDMAAATLVPQGDMRTARAWHTASRLRPRNDAPVIVAGGVGSDGEPLAAMEAMTLNAAQAGCPAGQSPSAAVGCWVQPQGVTLSTARFGHRAVAVGGERQILFVGGFSSADRTATATALDLVDVDFRMGGGPGQPPVGQLETGRGDLSATVLGDGSVLVTGGMQGRRPLRSSTRLVPCAPGEACPQVFTERRLPDGCGLSQERYGHEALRLQSGSILLLGGVGLAGPDTLTTMGRAELYFPAPAYLNEVYP
jgi:hypothetical protein